ncbi:MAG: hypothetical protein ACE5HD_12915, partial [Acidobacteriota bacterium]
HVVSHCANQASPFHNVGFVVECKGPVLEFQMFKTWAHALVKFGTADELHARENALKENSDHNSEKESSKNDPVGLAKKDEKCGKGVTEIDS